MIVSFFNHFGGVLFDLKLQYTIFGSVRVLCDTSSIGTRYYFKCANLQTDTLVVANKFFHANFNILITF